MKKQAYKVNEIFYSIQGEGFFTGTAAIFVRLSGCNLRCPFCDTEHNEGSVMSVADIANAVSKYPARLVVITGGEPSLQLTEELLDALHGLNKFVAVETNGTRPLPLGVDWITVSPKSDFVEKAEVITTRHYDEVKIVMDSAKVPEWALELNADHYFLQPCDTGDKEKNERIIGYVLNACKENPKWRISLQTQKILNVR